MTPLDAPARARIAASQSIPSRKAAATRWRINVVREWLQMLGAARAIRKEGLSRGLLGPDYVRRIELSGVPGDCLDTTLASIRTRGAWPRAWEAAGDEFAARDDHTAASAAYYMAQRWDTITRDERNRLYQRAVEHYRRMPHVAPLEAFVAMSGEREVHGIVQVPEGASSTAPAPVMIMFPGLGATKEELHPISAELLRTGIATCRIDPPGFGDTTGLLDEPPHVIGHAVVNQLRQDPRFDAGHVHAMGFCTGGLFAAGAAELDLAGLTLISTPIKPLGYLHRMPRTMIASLKTATAASSFSDVFDILRETKLVRLPRIECPIDVVYGGGDVLIPPSEIELVERYAGGPVSVHFFPEQPHACIGRFAEIVEVLSRQAHGDVAERADQAA